MASLTGKRFGFLGAGVIAEVFARRLVESGTAKADQIVAFDTQEAILGRLASALGIRGAACPPLFFRAMSFFG
jgi:pyrroline-5-carboxylate reductase